MNEARIQKIQARLAVLEPSRVEITDESHKHVGHAGAAGGGGHFNAEIVAAAFEGKSLVQRHRMVYEALGDMMQQEIHAFSMAVRTPEEDA